MISEEKLQRRRRGIMFTRKFASGRSQSSWLQYIVWPCNHTFNDDGVCTKCSVMKFEWTALLQTKQIATK